MNPSNKIKHHRLYTEGVSLHYVTMGEGRPLLLLHGFPQTWAQWLPLMERLPEGIKIIAPDLRGIGSAPGPMNGYDKHSLAADVHAIVRKECGDAKLLVCGHDMGSFVAFAYALNHREQVQGLILVDAPPPGTKLMDSVLTNPYAWHIGFHSQTDVAVMLVTGKEREYITQFITYRAYNPAAIDDAAVSAYVKAYSAPGALRAGFEMYRAFTKDGELNRAALARDGRLKMPLLAIGGAISLAGAALNEALDEVAENARAVVVAESGHWIPEEQPDVFAGHVLEFARQIGAL